jgi:hypothetical protein
MSEIRRNMIVPRLGTPDLTEGSVNDPRTYDENGVRWNEKWTYLHLVDDPSGLSQRLIYWHRYDFLLTMVRRDASEPWKEDRALAEDLAKANSRLAEHNPANNPPIVAGRYRANSETNGPADLGGYAQRREDIPEDERP